jgi:hypothetical protein
MKQNQIKLAKILTYSGTLPLIASVVTHYFPLTGWDSTLIAGTYAAIIISFLCGIHWAAYLFFANKCPRNLLISSNVVALLAWTAGNTPAYSNRITSIMLFLFAHARLKVA